MAFGGAFGLGLGLGLNRGRRGGSPGGNLVTSPAISGTPVVGETLTASSGTYDVTPTSYSYQWKRGGADISGATSMFYTLVEADAAAATRGNITCRVTANFASGGPLATLTAPTAMPRRTYSTLAIRTGRLTKVNHGGVSYNHPALKCLGIGASDGTWSRGTATTGTDGHWVAHATNPTITPIPSGNSVTVDPTYEFPVTFTHADGLVESITLTITTVATVQTISHRELFGSGTQVQTSHLVSGISALELATGIDTRGKRMQFQGLRPAALTIIRDADINRRAWAAEWDYLGLDNIDVQYLAARSAEGLATNCFHFCGPFSATQTGNLKITGPVARSDSATIAANIGTFNKFIGIRIGGAGTYTIDDPDFQYVTSGVSQDPLSGDVAPVTLTVNRARTRYFHDNAFLVGSSSATNQDNITLNDCISMSPMRAGASTTHADHVQTNDSSTNMVLTINRQMHVQADGNTYCQSVFGGQSDGVAQGPRDRTYIINGLIEAGRAYYGVAVGCGTNSSISAVTAWKTDSGEVATTSTENDGYVETGPYFLVTNTGNFLGTNTLTKSIFFGIDNDPTAIYTRPGSTNSFHNGSRTTPPQNTGFTVANPKTALDALTYTGRSIDDIVTDVKAALTPQSSGAYDLGVGAWKGALKGDGSWNVA